MKRRRIQLDGGQFPEAVLALIRDAAVYDSSCSREARVYYIERDGGLFLKTAPAGTLRAEQAMTAYFHARGLSGEVLLYASDGGRDYMVTRRVPGEDCTDAACLADPKRLCDTTARLLRVLHELDASDCPVRDRMAGYAAAVTRGVEAGAYEPELFAGMFEFDSPEAARQAAREGLSLLQNEVLLHGDYCLPNIILLDWRLSGYIDLGSGGLGDRHIDVLWGIWTLKYNLGTWLYTDRFIDAYGRDRVEMEKLRQIAAMEMIGG